MERLGRAYGLLHEAALTDCIFIQDQLTAVCGKSLRKKEKRKKYNFIHAQPGRKGTRYISSESMVLLLKKGENSSSSPKERHKGWGVEYNWKQQMRFRYNNG